MIWMLRPLRHYIDFSGRSRRMEFWMFLLFIALAGAVLSVFGRMLGMRGLLSGLFALAMFVPLMAVIVRRLQDQDKTGWLALLWFVPGLGQLIILILMAIEGTKGTNAYGHDPKA
jgi:uncharacterized membrane protein YhaH (DUF805 family)